ncbi:hypothetical protein [Skermanella pratensis]|uniref:hypothetical protein n=1 Tax=Skermanella pratensis TaxID=2233999 RepID=UPI001300F2C5|nr:hypothetical protein [Skermanella pratensis]
MATLEHLWAKGTLVKFEANLAPHELPHRSVYFAAQFDEWIEAVLYDEWSDARGRDMSPYEQVEAIFVDFVKGWPMVYGVHKKLLRPETRGIWSLRTPDVRIFGWFPALGTFLAVRGAMKRNLKQPMDYREHIDHVADFRDALPLDEPKSIAGTRPDENA